MNDALWIGVDSVNEGKTVASLNVFRKRGDSFDLVKIIEGKEAEEVYAALTEGGDETNVAEINL